MDKRWANSAVERASTGRGYNDVRAFLGGPGTGKSVAMAKLLAEASKRYYVLLHDPNLDFPRELPDGTPVPVVYHEDIKSVRAKLASKNPGGIHACYCDPAELIELAKEIVDNGTREAKIKGKSGEFAVPVIVALDEICAWQQEASRNRIGDNLLDLLARRRHYHIGFWFGAQYPRQMHYSLLHKSTQIYMFRIVEAGDLKVLEEGGVGSEYLSAIQKLPPCTHPPEGGQPRKQADSACEGHKFIVYSK